MLQTQTLMSKTLPFGTLFFLCSSNTAAVSNTAVSINVPSSFLIRAYDPHLRKGGITLTMIFFCHDETCHDETFVTKETLFQKTRFLA